MSAAHLNFAHLCDLAFLSQAGKLNIIGIFEQISVARFPARHPKLTLVMNLTLAHGVHPFRVRLLKDKDNQTVAQIEGRLDVQTASGNAGFINEFVDIVFDEPGKYSLEIWIDDEPIDEAGKLVFSVRQA